MMRREHFANRDLCLWLPQWPLQRVYMNRPELSGREIALYGLVRGCARIIAASDHRGVKPGMPLAEARSLGAIHCEQHDPQADAAALLNLAGWCEQFSPLVGIEPPDNLCLNVTGLGPLFGSERRLAQQVQQAFRARGFDCRTAIADTVGAAWAAAHFLVRSERSAAHSPRELRQSHLASGAAASPLVLPVGGSLEVLVPLPVASLRLPIDKSAILQELGIERVGQLLALPRDALVSRFGPELLRRLDQATGKASETIVSHRPPPDIVAERRLEYPAADRQAIDALLGELVESISRRLIERQAGAMQIECELCCEGNADVKVLIGLFRATAAAKHLRELIRLKLERTRLAAPIVAVKLSVATAAPLQCSQQELFEPSGREDRRQVGLLVDRLSSRLGREAVVRPVLQEEAQPEFAVYYHPLAGARPQKEKLPRGKRLPRPLRLEPKPIALEVLSVVPDGPPIQFALNGVHRVAKAWGPERIQTSWWRGRYIQRDYYRVETTAGKIFWLFRRLPDGAWFLQGAFD